MMKALIAIALLATAACALVPAAEARPLPCDPQVDPEHYVYVRCEHLFCVVIPLDGEMRYCTA
jgi:hypothetical protein